MRPNCAGSLILPSMRTMVSLCPRERRPAGTSWFAARIAFITWSTPMPSELRALGLIWMRICRVTLPLTSIRATPGTFSSPLTMVWSVSDVSSRRSKVDERTASETTGCWFSIVGAEDERILRVARERRPYQRHLVAHVLHRPNHVGVEPEFREHRAYSLERKRADQLDTGHAVDRVLERLGDVDLDLLGGGARIARLHDQERQIHLGHLLDAAGARRKTGRAP